MYLWECFIHFVLVFIQVSFLFEQNFQPILSWSAENSTKLNVQVKPVEPTLEAGAQIQQMLTAECIDDFTGTFISYIIIEWILVFILHFHIFFRRSFA